MNEALKNAAVWVVDDDDSIRFVLDKGLSKAGMQVTTFENAADLRAALEAGGEPQVVVSDIRMPGEDGLQLMAGLREIDPDLPVIIITAHSDLDSAVSAYEGGAFEYLPKPFDVNEAITLVERALQRRLEYAAEPAAEREPSPKIIGEAPAMQEVFRAIGRLARSHITVLITGESGTGKELVARALHDHSPRVARPFIALNTAAIPRDLLEAELFGHEKGAFTGADARREGRFEQADGGTLFLDEIGDMPAELQTRLLRVLADGEFYRIGGRSPVKVDVRIVAATHQDLEKRVAGGQFREDLLHRLNVIRIRLPALRERREDIPLLLEHFLDAAARELKAETKTLSAEVVALLSEYSWGGNVRQLENLCRWLTVMGAGREIHREDLPPEILGLNQGDDGALNPDADTWQSALRRWADLRAAGGDEAALEAAVPEFEKVLIEAALAQTGGRRQEAARILGWGRNTLTRKIKLLGL